MYRRRTAAVISLTYALIAGLWIASSDRLLSMLVEEPMLRMRMGSAKGFIYVAVTTLLLYLLLDSWAPGSQESKEEEGRGPRFSVVVAAFFGLALVVPVIGGAVVRLHGRQIELEAYANLQAVAELKGRQIQNWLAERDSDGRALALSSGFALQLVRWLNNGAPVERDQVQDRLSTMQRASHYEGVVLLDAESRTVFAIGSRQEVSAGLQPLIAQARIRKDVVRSDLYLDESGRLHLDWIVPIRNPLRSSENVIAFVLLHVEPDRALFPLIVTWHTPSPTAESFLVRRDADAVVYLNELRHRVGAPLSVRLPLASDSLPAAAAIVSGKPVTMIGIDYRGVSVLAATTPITETPWHLVTKVDREEVMAPLRNLVWWVSLVTICAIAAVAALILMYVRQQRRADRWAMQAEASRRIRELNAQLEQRVIARTGQLAEANRELESFAYVVSHDLKAPLRGIIGYSRVLQTEYSDQLDAEGKDFICQINHAATQMHQLIDDLLAYSRIERGAMTSAARDLAAFVDDVLVDCRLAIVESGATVRASIPRITVPFDSNGLSMALRNLIDNALKFCSDATSPQIEIGARIGPASCVIWVRDNGIGFDMCFHDKMFEIFSRLDSNGDYAGTGVGLAIVRKAMQRMGGRAWAEGEVGRGASFFLELPLVPPVA